jgi:hypothetical protein
MRDMIGAIVPALAPLAAKTYSDERRGGVLFVAAFKN